MRKKIALAALAALLIFSVGCSKDEQIESEGVNTVCPIVTFEMENGSKIVMELYTQYAPNTVANFVELAQDGFFDGLTFHRAVPGFVIQGGDTQGDGTGGSGMAIKGEFKSNGYKANTLSHTRGVVSMARLGHDMNSATSQFFIVLSDNAKSSLDGDYAGFGKVIEGMDEVDRIAELPVVDMRSGQIGHENQPKIVKATVDLKGVDLPAAERTDRN